METYGLTKHGGQRFAYTDVRGYHPLLASLAETGELLHARLRGGSANTGRGAASFIAETTSTAFAGTATRPPPAWSSAGCVPHPARSWR